MKKSVITLILWLSVIVITAGLISSCGKKPDTTDGTGTTTVENTTTADATTTVSADKTVEPGGTTTEPNDETTTEPDDGVKKVQLTLIVDSTMGSVLGAGEYRVGDPVSIIATAKKGYEFKGWYNDGTLISEGVVYAFLISDNDYSLTAVFEKISEQ